MQIIELPASIKWLKDFSSLLISWKCKPVVGSSKINSEFWLFSDLVRKDASLILYASPPLRVLEDCPNVK